MSTPCADQITSRQGGSVYCCFFTLQQEVLSAARDSGNICRQNCEAL